MDETNYNYFLSIPVVLSMLMNFIFLINIVRVLVTKLRAANASPDHNATRKVNCRVLLLEFYWNKFLFDCKSLIDTSFFKYVKLVPSGMPPMASNTSDTCFHPRQDPIVFVASWGNRRGVDPSRVSLLLLVLYDAHPAAPARPSVPANIIPLFAAGSACNAHPAAPARSSLPANAIPSAGGFGHGGIVPNHISHCYLVSGQQ